MKRVFIKYNPYKLETKFTVDGQELAENSILREKIFPGITDESVLLQDWIEELPRILVDEFNDISFEITFNGTIFDYNDLVAVMTEAAQNGEFSATTERIPAKETTDKEKLIDKVVAKITSPDCPFDPEQVRTFKANFDKAKDLDFEVCVVATMSAGKSTLINAMLGTKLMPSAAEAYTAIITRIKDVSQDNIPFRAEAYNKEGKRIESYDNLNRETMNRLNQDEQVSEIRIEGNIPFVTSDDVSLVLVDTPNFYNARNYHEYRKVQNAFLNQSGIVIYVLTGWFGTHDDKALIARVAESMSKGGKQSKDRVLFAVNKLDSMRSVDDTIEESLERMRSYLQDLGVSNPNIFPMAALPAMNIRLMQRGEELDDDTIDYTEFQIRKLNRNPQMHFETYASLPRNIRREIDEQLEMAKEEADDSRTNPNTALIHSGIPSIEAAIRQHVQKYAKPAKIRCLAEMIKALFAEWAYVAEKIKTDIDIATTEQQVIRTQITAIEAKMNELKVKLNELNLERCYPEVISLIEEMEKLVTTLGHIDKEISTANRKLAWFECIQAEMDSILEI